MDPWGMWFAGLLSGLLYALRYLWDRVTERQRTW